MIKKVNKKQEQEYLTLIEVSFNKGVSKFIKKSSLETFVMLDKDEKVVLGVCIKKLSNITNLYGVMYLVTHSSNKKQGYGTNLMKEIHNLYSGIFLLKTRLAENFYKRLGYIPFKKTNIHTYMIFMNKNLKNF